MLPHNYKIKTLPDLFMAWDKDTGEFADPDEYAGVCRLTESPWGDDGQMHIQALGRYIKLNYVKNVQPRDILPVGISYFRTIDL